MGKNKNSSVPMGNIEEQNKRKDFWVVFLNICLALATIVLLGYIAYKNGHIDLDNILNVQEDTDIEEEEMQEDEDILVIDNGEFTLGVFEGEIIEAIIPGEWTIVEYLDGEGTDMLPTYTSFDGLTGLEIYHGEKKIMELLAAWAVGFPECPELVIFSDTDPNYVSDIEQMAVEYDSETLITDYSDYDYSSFDWFGANFRRVGYVLYSDSTDTRDTFDTQCQTSVVYLPLLSFKDGDGESGSVYFYYIYEDATPEELTMLDGILASMLVRN